MYFLILGLILLMFIFETYVEILNYRYRHSTLPNNVKDLYDSQKYQKWLSYKMATFKFGMIKNTSMTLILFVLLAIGFFGRLETMTLSMSQSSLMQNLFFLFAFYLINFTIGLPFKYYGTFVIEQRFGFNRSTKKTFIIDRIKGFILTIILGGGLIILLFSLYQSFKVQMVLFLSITFVAITLIVFIISLLSGIGLRLFNRFTPLEEGDLKMQIESLSNRLGFQIKRISIMDGSKRSSKLNAFFTGIGKTKEVALYDTLIEKMSTDEILAVLAHELGHAANKDTLKMFFHQIFAFLIYIVILGLIFTQENLHTAFGLSGVHFGFSIILMMVIISPINVILQSYFNFQSRVMEYKADAFAAKHTSKIAISGALRVLAVENLTNLTPHPLYVGLYYNHPTISQRLSSIETSV